MYLLVWPDLRARLVRENLTLPDYVAAAQGLLAVFRVDPAAGEVRRLVFDLGRACWVPVPEARVAISADVRLHY